MALQTHGIIDQTVGIMMSRIGDTARDALERLRAVSSHQHTRLTEMARQLVDEAVRRAQARHRPEH